MLSSRKNAIGVLLCAFMVRPLFPGHFSPLCLHSGAWVVFRFRAVFAALSPLRCVSGSESARRVSSFRSVSTPADSWPCLPSLRPRGRFRFFFEPSRVSEALCRRQEPREGVPKRARACERGGEARRREPRGRLTTTYRTINARLPPDCERLLTFNFFSLSLRLFPENGPEGVLAGSQCGVFSFGPLFVTLSSLRCMSGFPLSRRFLRSVSTPVRQRFRERAPSVVFPLSPLRSTVGLVFPRSGRGAVFAFL